MICQYFDQIGDSAQEILKIGILALGHHEVGMNLCQERRTTYQARTANTASNETKLWATKIKVTEAWEPKLEDLMDNQGIQNIFGVVSEWESSE
jgi:hypothetical protein